MTSSDEDDECWEEIQLPLLSKSSLDCSDENSAPPNGAESSLEITVSSTKRKRPAGSTKRDNLIRTEIHKTHLLCLLQRAIELNRITDDEEIQCLAFSLIPAEVSRRINQAQDIGQFVDAIEKRLLAWWQAYVAAPKSGNDLLNDDSSISRLAKCLNGFAQFDRINTVLGFIAACRALKLETRLVVSLQPLPFRSAHLKSFEKAGVKPSSTESNSEQRESPKCGNDDDGNVPSKRQRKSSKPRSSSDKHQSSQQQQFSECWTEIFCPPTNQWLVVDALRGLVNKISEMEPPAGAGWRQLAYVIAIESISDYVKDVTRRYSSRFQTHTRKYRLEDWWTATLESCNPGKPANRSVDRLETEQLLRLSQKEALPNSIQAYHNHPTYVLERHLKKFEYIYPRTGDVIVGQVRGENIYLRSAVQLLHTKEKWFSLQARIIQRDQLNQPVKIVKSRQQPQSSNRSSRIRHLGRDGDGDEEAGEEMDDDFSHILGTVDKSVVGEGHVGLYGRWQTEPYIPAPIVDGIIPKNRYNNIDLFLPSLLPPGAVHITEQSLVASISALVGGQRLPDTFRMPSLKKLMRSIDGVDYAEAVVGFEYHGGRSVPTTDGIVVAVENEQRIRQAFEEQCLSDLSRLLGERQGRAVKNWRQLVRKWMIRDRLFTRFTAQDTKSEYR